MLEEDVQESLSLALKVNLFVPDLLFRSSIEEKEFKFLDGDVPAAAHSYVQDAHGGTLVRSSGLQPRSFAKKRRRQLSPTSFESFATTQVSYL